MPLKFVGDVLAQIGPYPAVGVLIGGLVGEFSKVVDVPLGAAIGGGIGLAVMFVEAIQKQEAEKREAEAARKRAQADGLLLTGSFFKWPRD